MSSFRSELKAEIATKLLKSLKKSSPNTKRLLLAYFGTMLFLALAVPTQFIFLTDSYSLDFLLQLRGNRARPDSVAIVALDNESSRVLKMHPMMPFDRKVLADAIIKVHESGARAVIIDANVPSQGERAVESSDSLLEHAIRVSKATLWDGTRHTERGAIEPLPSEDRFRKAASMELPMTFSSPFGFTSHVMVAGSDTASPYRQVPLMQPLEELAGYTISSPDSRYYLNPYGDPAGTNGIRAVPLFKVLEMSAAEARSVFRDKVVFLGARSEIWNSGQDFSDTFRMLGIPHRVFGVEVHATIAANLIDESWIRRANPLSEILLMLMIGTLVCFIALHHSLVIALSGYVLTILSAWGVGFALLLSSTPYLFPGLGALTM